MILHRFPRLSRTACQPLWRGFALIALVSLAACATVKVDVPPSSMPVPPAFDTASRVATAATADIDQWWQAWNDPVLNGLVAQGLRANADVRMALAHVREARQTVTMAESALYPQVAVVGATGHDKGTARLPAPLPALSPPVGAFDTAGPVVAWELDLFGMRRNDAQAARQYALAVEEQLAGARLLVAGDIVTNYLEARAVERRQDVLSRLIAVAREGARYADGRFEAGQATRADVDRARTAVEEAESQQAPLTALLETRLRRLSVLTGQLPAALRHLPAPRAGPALPELLPATLPSQVLERRPDVRGAAHAVGVQAARLGAARAELLPRFTFGFLMQDGHIGVSGLPSLGGNVQVWGVGVHLPLFTGGRLSAQVRARDASLEAAVARYEQAVLVALEDVDNAFGARWALDQRSGRLARATLLTQAAAHDAQALYEDGHILLQAALDARAAALRQEDELIQTETARGVMTVQLYKALGGTTGP